MLTVPKSLMKKFLQVFLIFAFLLISPGAIFAQEQNDVSVSVQNADESSDIDVSILNVTSSKGEVYMEVEVSNNTDSFVDTLKYDAELYQGDSLQEFGYVFGSVDYVYTGSGELESLDPGETKKITTSFSIPESLDKDTYFLRLSLYTKDTNRVAVSYTEDSFWILGDGGYLGAFSAYVDIDGDRYTPDTGLPLPQSVEQFFEIPLEFNKTLDSYLSSGKKLNAQVLWSSVTRKGEVNTQTEWINLKDLIKDNSIYIPIVPEKKLVSGPYTVEIKYSDFSGEDIATNSYARLYIEGLTARIVSIDTSINKYKKGQKTDLVVPVAFGGHDMPETVSVEAEFLFRDGEIVKIQKDFSVETNDEEAFVGDVDFTDLVMKKSGLVERVIVTVKNDDGERIAFQDLEINTDKEFTKKTSLIFYLQILGILFVIVLIILIIKRFFPHMLDENKNSALQIALLIASSSLIATALLITTSVSAQPSNNDGYTGIHTDTFMDIWTSLPDENTLKSEGVVSSISTNSSNYLLPSGEQSSCTTGRDLFTDIYVRLRCAHCLNGVSGEIKLMSSTDSNPSFSFNSPVDYKVFIHSGGGHKLPLTVTEGDYGLTSAFGIYTLPTGGNAVSPQKTIGGFQGQAGTYGPFKLPIGLNEDVSSLSHGDIITKTYRVWGKTYGGLHCTLSKERVTQHSLSCKVDLDICDDIVGVQTEVPKVGDSVQLESDPNKTVVVGNITGPIVNGNSSTCPFTVAEKPTISCSGDSSGKVNTPVKISANASGKNPTIEWSNYSPNESRFTNKSISSNTNDLTFTPNDIGKYSVDMVAIDEYGQKSEKISCAVDIIPGDITPDVSAICPSSDEKLYPGDDFSMTVRATSNIPSQDIEIKVNTVGFDWSPLNSGASQTTTGRTSVENTSTHRVGNSVDGYGYGNYSLEYEVSYLGNTEKVSGSCPIKIQEPLTVSCNASPSGFNESYLDNNNVPYVSVSDENIDGVYKENVTIDWYGSVSGGEGPYTYKWSSLSDAASDNSPKSPNSIISNAVRTTYDNNKSVVSGVNYALREGRKISRLTVTDANGNTGFGTCSVSIDVETDYCKNIPGVQSTMPEGYQMDKDNYLFCQKDVCSDIDGIQTEAPYGRERKNNNTCPLIKPKTQVSCNVQNENPKVGEPINFVARIINGEGPFDYTWGNANEIQRSTDGRSSLSTQTFTQEGHHDVYVTAYEDDEHVSYTVCGVDIGPEIVITEDPDFRVSCSFNPSVVKQNETVSFESKLTYPSDASEYFENTFLTYTWAGDTTNKNTHQLSFDSVGEQVVTVVVSDGVRTRSSDCVVNVEKGENNLDICLNIQGTQSDIPKPGDTYKFEGDDTPRTVSELGMIKSGDNCYPNIDTSTKVSCSVSPGTLPGNGVVTLTPVVSGGPAGIVPKTLSDYDISWTTAKKENSVVELNNSKKQAEFNINSASVGYSSEYAELYVSEDGVLLGSASCEVKIEPIDICKNIDGIQSDMNLFLQNNFYFQSGVKKLMPKNGFDISPQGICTPKIEDKIDICKNIQGIQEKLPLQGETYRLEGDSTLRTVSDLGMNIVGDGCYPNVKSSTTKVSCSVSPGTLKGNGVVTLTPNVSGGISIVPKSISDYDISWATSNKENSVVELNNPQKQAQFNINSASSDTPIESADMYVTEDGVLVGSARCEVIVDYNGDKEDKTYPLSTTCVASPSELNGNGGKVLLTPYIVGGSGNWTVQWFGRDQDGNTITPRNNSLKQAYFNVFSKLDVAGERYAGYEVTDSVTGAKAQSSCAVYVDPTVDLECRHDKESQKVSAGETVEFTLTAKLGTGTYKYKWNNSNVSGLNILSSNTPTNFKTSFTQGGDIVVTGEVEFTDQGNQTVTRNFVCPSVEVKTPSDLCQNIDGAQWPSIPSPGQSYTINGVRSVVPSDGLYRDSNNICSPNKISLSCFADPDTAFIGDNVFYTANASNAVGSVQYVWGGPINSENGNTASRVVEDSAITNPKTVAVSVQEVENGNASRSVKVSCPLTVKRLPPDQCPNIDGNQATIPAEGERYSIDGTRYIAPEGGLSLDSDGNCTVFTNVCRVQRFARVNYLVDFKSNTNGGSGTLFKWSGDNVPSFYNRYNERFETLTLSFQNTGIYNITSTAKNGSSEKTSVCTVDVRPYSETLGGGCTATPTPVCVSGTNKAEVNWLATGTGGSGEYSFKWSGAVSGSNTKYTTLYGINDLGKKTSGLIIDDGSTIVKRSCSVEVLNADTDIRCIKENEKPRVSCKPKEPKVQAGYPVEWIIDSVEGGTAPYVFSWSPDVRLGYDPKTGSGAFSKFPSDYFGNKSVSVTVIDKNGELGTGVCSVELVDGPLPPPKDICPNISGNQNSLPRPGEQYILTLNGQRYTVPSSGMKIDADNNCVPIVPYSVSCSPLRDYGSGDLRSIQNNTIFSDPNTDIKIVWESTLNGVPSGYTVEWEIPGVSGKPKQRIVPAVYNLNPGESKTFYSNLLISHPETNTYAQDRCYLTVIVGGNPGNDLCPNIDGTQEDIPEPRESYFIDGVEYIVPDEGLAIDENGNCVNQDGSDSECKVGDPKCSDNGCVIGTPGCDDGGGPDTPGDPNDANLVAKCHIVEDADTLRCPGVDAPYFRADSNGNATITFTGSATSNGNYTYNYSWYEGEPGPSLGKIPLGSGETITKTFKTGGHNVFTRVFTGTGPSDESEVCTFFVAPIWCDVKDDPKCEKGPGGDSGDGEIKEI